VKHHSRSVLRRTDDEIRVQLQQAVEFHQRGAFDQARVRYEEILTQRPRHDSVLHCLGLLCSHQGHLENALGYLSRAISINPARDSYHLNRGNVLQAMGRLREAISSYDAALALSPNNILVAYNKAVALQGLNLHRAAIEGYDQIIHLQSDHAEAFYNRANSKHSLGLSAAAIEDFRMAAQFKPDWVEAHFNLGVLYHEAGHIDLAASSYQNALLSKPSYVQAQYNLGLVNQARGQIAEAIRNYAQVLQQFPDHGDAILNQGVALKDSGDIANAMVCFDRLISLNVRLGEAFFNKALALKQLGELEAAVEYYDRAIAHQPEFPEAWLNKGVVLMEQRFVPAAVACYDRAIEQSAHFPEALENKGSALLMLGDYARGWDLYEHRWNKKRAALARRDFGAPVWTGTQSLEGQTILLWAEQGLGDTLQFGRYAQTVASLGGRVILEVQAPLVRLLQGLAGADSVVARGSELPSIDWHCSLMSLPRAFQTTIDTVPHAGRYLEPDPSAVQQWQERLGVWRRPRVGLVWSGGFRPNQPELWKVNERRNIPLQLFKRFGGLPIDFYSLQKGQSAEAELEALEAASWPGPKIINLVDQLTDFAETAALIEQLDLVISVDTSTAHLAGALGKPVWILNRFDSCWRWLLEREDSPWYASARLYRQTAPGDWDGVIQRVENDLGRVG